MKKRVGRILGIIYETPRIKETKRGKYGYYHIFHNSGIINVDGKKIECIFPEKIKFVDNRGFLN